MKNTEWQETVPSKAYAPEVTWYRGACRVDRVYGAYLTRYKSERANNGTNYKTLHEAQVAVLTWACNQAKNDLDAIGIRNDIEMPDKPKPACEHRCYTCGKPLSECADERWAMGK